MRNFTIRLNEPAFKKSLFILLLSFLSFAAQAVSTNTQAVHNKNIELYFFWSHRCPHCLTAKPFVENLAERYSWLTLHSHDLINNQLAVNLYIKMAKQLKQNANAVPGFIFCEQMLIGFDSIASTGKELEQKLLACHQKTKQQTSAEEFFEIPLFGKIHYQDFSLPVFTLIIAALDAFNPCAFFVLFFLLSLIVHTRERFRIAMVGGTFVFFSGLMYFIFMAAWLNLFLLTQQLSIITAIAGLIAIIVGMVNIKDYFFFKQGVSLSIPDTAKSQLFKKMRHITQTAQWPAMLAATALLAIVANSYELLCTAGLPMVYTRVLTLNELSSTQYYLYLAFYNLIYIVPLLMIVSLFTITLGNKKLSEQEGRLLKLLSGGMMLGLGGLLFFAPDLLNNMLASISVIAIAIIITLALALIERYQQSRHK